jgi:CxxC motif-containing protein
MRKFICIVCPKGCHLEVDDNLKVTGNSCKRGETYGISEATNPVRMVTSTVKIKSELITRLPVRTNQPIPKSRIFDVMAEINKLEVVAPIAIRSEYYRNKND